MDRCKKQIGKSGRGWFISMHSHWKDAKQGVAVTGEVRKSPMTAMVKVSWPNSLLQRLSSLSCLKLARPDNVDSYRACTSGCIMGFLLQRLHPIERTQENCSAVTSYTNVNIPQPQLIKRCSATSHRRNAVAISNTTMSPNYDKSFHNEWVKQWPKQHYHQQNN